MKKFILANLLFISSVAVFSQNLINNESNVSLGNLGGNYYSNVLSNGGGNSVMLNTNLTITNISAANNQQQSVQVRSNVSVNRGNTRELNNPVIVQNNIAPDFDAINLVVNKPQVTITKLPNVSRGPVLNKNIKSDKKVSGSTTHKKVRNNFYTQTKTRVKHKRKPGFKKVKYHTSKCAVW